jgi:LacI family transcriptional regulator
MEINPQWILQCKDISEQEGFDFTKKLIESPNPPDAIFCITDLVAMGAMKYLKSKNIKIPDQIGVLGFSNWQIAEFVSPSLSSVDQHGFEMGIKATEILIDLLKNNTLGGDETIEMKTELVIRESSQLNSKLTVV